MASIDSFLASSMKPQVLTIEHVGRLGSKTTSPPSRAISPNIISLSTKFFGQPRLCRKTFAPIARAQNRNCRWPLPQYACSDVATSGADHNGYEQT